MDENQPCYQVIKDNNGNEIRKRCFLSLSEAVDKFHNNDPEYFDFYLSVEEYAAGFYCETFCYGIMVDTDVINNKVIELIRACFARGILTTLSGDMYEDKCVYVDLDCQYSKILKNIVLPNGWVVSGCCCQNTYKLLGIDVETLHCEDNCDLSLDRRRLARKGGYITKQEAEMVVSSIIGAIEHDN